MSPSATDIVTDIESVYLSGPITGMPDLNEPAFTEAAADLRVRGLTVFNPMEHQDSSVDVEGPAAYKHYMTMELPEVIAADAVVVLDGWQNSAGARLEVHTALTCSIPVLSYPDLLPVDVRVIMGRNTATAGPFAPPTPTMLEDAKRETFAKDTWMSGSYLDGTGRLPDEEPFPFAGGGQQRIVTNAVTGGQKETRPARMDLLPWDQLWKVAELYAYGAQKYEDRNWERGYAFSLSIAALLRHMSKFVQGEDDDPETGCSHLASVVFHALALMRFVEQTQLDLLPQSLDDRPVGARVRAREDQS